MSLIEIIASEGHAVVELPFPPVVFAAIAAAVFAALGFVMWSFRDAANRHSRRTSGSDRHTTDFH
ncbi:MAG TPA: hypothetical protein VGP10_00920 [Marisediminicola sp.]|jgi:hypothetical protein|nr:hypothetical protein [Marisediminicola sp.]